MIDRAAHEYISDLAPVELSANVAVNRRIDRQIAAQALYWTLSGGKLRDEEGRKARQEEMARFATSLSAMDGGINRPECTPGHDTLPHLIRALTSICKERALYVTNEGFLGLGPLHTRPGDRICALASAAVPMVMRFTGVHYELLGETYFHPTSPIAVSSGTQFPEKLDMRAIQIYRELNGEGRDHPDPGNADSRASATITAVPGSECEADTALPKFDPTAVPTKSYPSASVVALRDAHGLYVDDIEAAFSEHGSAREETDPPHLEEGESPVDREPATATNMQQCSPDMLPDRPIFRP